MIDNILKFCPKLKSIIENRKKMPTELERIEALEAAVSDLALAQLEAQKNETIS